MDDGNGKQPDSGEQGLADKDGEVTVTLTVRLIRSFAHRNLRHIVLKDVDLDLTGEQLLHRCLEQAASSASSLPPPFKLSGYDCMKIEHFAHGFKTSDPCLNRENDDVLILRPTATLREAGIKNETEVALFKRDDYEEYKRNQDLKW